MDLEGRFVDLPFIRSLTNRGHVQLPRQPPLHPSPAGRCPNGSRPADRTSGPEVDESAWPIGAVRTADVAGSVAKPYRVHRSSSERIDRHIPDNDIGRTQSADRRTAPRSTASHLPLATPASPLRFALVDMLRRSRTRHTSATVLDPVLKHSTRIPLGKLTPRRETHRVPIRYSSKPNPDIAPYANRTLRIEAHASPNHTPPTDVPSESYGFDNGIRELPERSVSTVRQPLAVRERDAAALRQPN